MKQISQICWETRKDIAEELAINFIIVIRQINSDAAIMKINPIVYIFRSIYNSISPYVRTNSDKRMTHENIIRKKIIDPWKTIGETPVSKTIASM